MKTTKLLILFLSAIFIVAGCSKSDSDMLTPKNLEGEWIRSGDAAGSEFWTLINGNGTGKVALFTGGKSFPSFIQFHWKSAGKTLTLTDYDTGANIVCEVTELTKSQMQVSVTYPWDPGNKKQETWLRENFSAKFSTPHITLTTKRTDNKINLAIKAAVADRPDVWIDLNNNGKKDAGESSIKYNDLGDNYTRFAQTVTLYGKVTELDCQGNSLTALSVSKNTALASLSCHRNQLEVAALHKIIDDLPMRKPDTKGRASLYSNPGVGSITDAYKKKGKEKHWEIHYVRNY